MEENTYIGHLQMKSDDKYMIDPRLIVVQDNFNARCDFGDLTELAESIKANGVLNPITVIPFEDEESNQTKYRLIDGERRYRASMKVLEDGGDLRRIPAIFASKSLTKEQMLIQQLVRNEGKPYSEYEYGIAYRKLVDLGYTPKEIAEKTGKPLWQVDICLGHTERDQEIQEAMRKGDIDGSMVRKIDQAHKNDQQRDRKVKKEIMKAIRKHKEEMENGTTKKKTVTINDLEKFESRTLIVRDTAAIRKGLEKFIEYATHYMETTDDSIELDISAIFNLLNDNKTLTIDDAFKMLSMSQTSASGSNPAFSEE